MRFSVVIRDTVFLTRFRRSNSENSNKFEIFYSVNPSPEGAGETRLSTGNRISRPGTKTLAECALDGGGLAWEMVCGARELSHGHVSLCSRGTVEEIGIERNKRERIRMWVGSP